MLEAARRVVDDFLRASGPLPFAAALVNRDGAAAIHVSGGATPETPLPICSTTKVVTAVVLLRLVERGLLSLEDPCLTDFPPLVHLLSHRSGIPDAEVAPEALPEQARIAEPGEVFAYSNLGFDAAGYAAGRATGKSFAELARELVLDPLDMSRSSFDAPGVTPASSPSGGLACTIGDLAKLAREFLNGASRILSLAHVTLMSRIHGDAVTAPFRYYGLGIGIEFWRGHRVYQHGGGLPGFGSCFHLVPEPGWAYVALFRAPEGYALHPYDVLDPLITEEGKAKPPDDLPIDGLRDGEFVSSSGDRLILRFGDGGLGVERGGRRIDLEPLTPRLYRSPAGDVHVGLVPGAAPNPAFVMWNEHPIGFVSAVPYRRSGAGLLSSRWDPRIDR